MNFLSFISVLIVAINTQAFAQSDKPVERWRVTDDSKSETIQLFAANMDATDAFGKFSFECVRHQGMATATIILDDAESSEVGQIVAGNTDPGFELLPDARGDGIKIIMSDLYGWMLSYEIDVSSQFFISFAQTGTIKYQFSNTAHDYSFVPGKEVIPDFIKACSK